VKKKPAANNNARLPVYNAAMREEQKHAAHANEYHANVPALYAPRITGKVKKNGEEFYIDAAGKLYRPYLYDKMFAVQRGQIKGPYYKGENPNYLLVD